jgi:hypothetical protein
VIRDSPGHHVRPAARDLYAEHVLAGVPPEQGPLPSVALQYLPDSTGVIWGTRTGVERVERYRRKVTFYRTSTPSPPPPPFPRPEGHGRVDEWRGSELGEEGAGGREAVETGQRQRQAKKR